MWFLPRFRARRGLDAASAEALLAGRGVAPGAPADQQALARLLEVAAGPGTGRELDGEVAGAAMFVQVTSEAKPHRPARRALVVAACVAVGGTAVFVSVVPVPHHKMAPVPYGVPAGHRSAPGSPAVRAPSPRPATSRRDADLRSPPAERSASRRRPRSGGS